MVIKISCDWEVIQTWAWWIGVWGFPASNPAFSKRKITCFLSIKKSLACARASKLTTNKISCDSDFNLCYNREICASWLCPVAIGSVTLSKKSISVDFSIQSNQQVIVPLCNMPLHIQLTTQHHVLMVLDDMPSWLFEKFGICSMVCRVVWIVCNVMRH